MHSIWSGSLSFGLVNIPMKLYSATAGTQLDLDYLHKKDLAPIRYAKVCTLDGKEIAFEDVVKGYQYKKGDYIVLNDADFKKADLEKTESIDVFAFVNEAEVDSIYSEKPYYLEPDKGSGKAYVVLREALKKSKKVGLCQFVLRSREHLGMIKVSDNLLVLDQLRFQEEIREPTGLKIPSKEAIKANEVQLAIELIEKLTEHFSPEDYHDTYRKALDRVIKAKIKGQKVKSKGKTPKPTQVTNLLSTLKASLEESRLPLSA